MPRKKIDLSGQSISEYVILIGIVSMALLAMQTYMKRGIQAVVKVAADEMSQDAGGQQKGLVEYNSRADQRYDTQKQGSALNAATIGSQATELKSKGEVVYARTETNSQSGGLAYEKYLEKE